MKNNSTKKIVRLSLFLALGVVLNIIESKYAETGATMPKKDYEHQDATMDYIKEGGYYLIKYEKGFLRAWAAIKV